MKEDIPILQRQVENGEIKATQLQRCRSQIFLSFSVWKCSLASSNKLFPQRIQQLTEEKAKNRAYKQGIKLPLYKNRSFSKCFFSFLFFKLEHFTVYATKKAVIVSQAQLFLITLFEHTIAKQHRHFGGFKDLTFLFSLFRRFLRSRKLPRSWFFWV